VAKALKHMLAAQLEADLKDSPGVLLIDPGNMTVEMGQALRADLREKAGGARMRVIHNRTAGYAFDRLLDDASGLKEELNGPNAVAYGGEGPIPIAKVIKDWQKKLKTLKVKAAVADGELLVGAEAAALADMPDLEQLKGMLAVALISSARGIAGSLHAVYGGLARCIQARVDESDESDESGESGEGEEPAE
jgi:large subunit ribosomal protein L10